MTDNTNIGRLEIRLADIPYRAQVAWALQTATQALASSSAQFRQEQQPLVDVGWSWLEQRGIPNIAVYDAYGEIVANMSGDTTEPVSLEKLLTACMWLAADAAVSDAISDDELPVDHVPSDMCDGTDGLIQMIIDFAAEYSPRLGKFCIDLAERVVSTFSGTRPPAVSRYSIALLTQ